MTQDQFKQKLAKPEKFGDILNYLICILIIGMGFWFIFDLIRNDFHHPEMGGQRYLILLFPSVFIISGLYGFWRIPRDYQIHCIDSLKPVDEKLDVVEGYLSQLKIESKKITGNHVEFIYINRFLNSLVVNLHLDDDKILFNIRSVRSGGRTGSGFMDFNLSSRASKRLKRYLKDRL